ncbi:Na-translocating system protein MpsC family protein [Robertmurraya sp. P23]|uniref:Na-translocating system protein MpsC family protein n=1 Tax=Robertmurraya sp. P23 TaxID=3436931 RepID=UPI003D972B53
MLATQDDLHALSSSFSKLLKRGFGKGPETCFTVFKGNKLYVYIRNFMTPAEEILYNDHQNNLITEFRTSVIRSLSDELLQESSRLLGMPFHSFYQDWNYDTNSGMLLLVSNSVNLDLKTEEKGSDGVNKVIRKIGTQFHKIPVTLRTVPSPTNSYAVESKGVLLPLENFIYERGQMELLLTQARNVKKGYMTHKNIIEEALNRSIEDIFMMWDYVENKNYLIFIFGRIN